MKPIWIVASLAILLAPAMPARAQGQAAGSGGFRLHAARGADGRDQGRISVGNLEGGAYSPELNWRCAGDSGYYLYVSGTPLTDDSLLAARWRFDQDAPQQGSWRVTAEHAWATTGVNEFTNRALSAREVTIVLTNSGGSFFSSTYRLQGLRAAMSQLGCLRGLAAAVPGESRPPPR